MPAAQTIVKPKAREIEVPAAAPTPGTAEAIRAAAMATTRAAPARLPASVLEGAKGLYEAFRGAACGFDSYPAALLAAHLILTKDGADELTRGEAEAFFASFARMHPVPYFDAKNGNLNGFVASMTRSNLEVATAREYTEIVSQIVG